MDRFLAILEQRLKDHDWFYQMSDDHRTWKAGNQDRKEIEIMIRAMVKEGHADKVRAMLDEHTPKTDIKFTWGQKAIEGAE